MNAMNTVRIEGVKAKVQTDRALLVDIDGDDYWVPQSVIHEDSEVFQKGDEGDLVVLEWWARQKGLA